jgi:hypothetical protein
MSLDAQLDPPEARLDTQLEPHPALRSASRASTPRSASRGIRWTHVGIVAALVAAVVPYAVSIAGPLRLDTDSVIYLGTADHIPLPAGHQSYPPVYPWLLGAAEHVGLGSAWGFVVMQLAVFAVGLACVYLLCRRPVGLDPMRAALVCLAVLLSHRFLRLTPDLSSDVPYFTAAMLALLALTRAEERSDRARVGLLALGCGLTALAVGVRIAGVALLPAVAIAAVGQPRMKVAWRWARRRRAAAAAIAGIALVAGVLVGVLVARVTGYAHNVTWAWRDIHSTGELISRVGVEAKSKALSFGDVGDQSGASAPIPTAVSYLSAGAMLVLLAVGWRAHRRFGAIEAFVIGTAAVVLAYAGGYPRFWMAASPFLFAYAVIAAEQLARFRLARLALSLWALGYVVAGAAVAAHGIEQSTSGRQFPDHWEPQQSVVATYRVAFGEARPGDRAKVIPAELQELRRYEPLAR